MGRLVCCLQGSPKRFISVKRFTQALLTVDIFLESWKDAQLF